MSSDMTSWVGAHLEKSFRDSDKRFLKYEQTSGDQTPFSVETSFKDQLHRSIPHRRLQSMVAVA